MRTFNAGDRYTVVFQRDGVAVIDGFVVLTEGALAGEKAVIELVSVNKSHGRARIVELLSRSCDRVMPDCERYGVCGGCQLMHQSYEGQLKAKENLVLQALERIGKMRDFSFQPISPSPRIFNYRNKTEFRFSGGKTGFFASSSHDLVPTDSCLIASDAANYAARLFSDAAEKYGFDSDGILTVRNSRGGDFGAVVETVSGNAAESVAGYISEDGRCKGVLLRTETGEKLFGERGICETVCGKRFFISHDAFFQVNTEQTEILYGAVSDLLCADENTVLLDAYCGVGTIGIAAAPRAKAVIGIEINGSAVEDARLNARLNGVQNARYIKGRCEEKYAECERSGVNAVVCDPPRAGCGREFIDFLLRLTPEKIVYVSCDPATLARDISLLSGCYKTETVRPFDMFPHTGHVETVCLLTKKGPK